MTTAKGSELINLIRSLGDLGYVRVVGWGETAFGQERPPLTVWRFKESQPGLEELLQEAVGSFKGRVAWVMFKGTRNWCIEPLHAKDFFRSRDFRGDVEAAIAFGKEFPDEVLAAYQDLPELAAHICRRLAQQSPIRTQTSDLTP